MAELAVRDGDGETQWVWMQERGDTCGPACIYMLESLKTQSCLWGGEVRVREITARMPKGYKEGSGTAAYTALAQALRADGINAYAMKVTDLPGFVGERFFPFIARVAWPSGGGHFVLALKVTKNGKLCCLDPWYGLVEAPLKTLPAYPVGSDYRKGVCLVNEIGGTLSGHVIYEAGVSSRVS